MKKIFAESGDVILEVFIFGAIIALAVAFFDTNGTVQTIFSDMFTKLSSFGVTH